MSARGIIESTLARYGLSSLADWAWTRYTDGQSIEQITLEMRETQTYKNRFPAMQDLAQQGRAMSEEAYMEYEGTIRELTSRFGLPSNVYGSRDYVAELLRNDVSPAEAQSRMQLASSASLTAPEEYRQQASELFGVSSEQWTSLWLETERTLPELERLFTASAIAGEATIQDLGQLSSSMAERLAESGVEPQQAREAFGSLSSELTTQLPGERTQPLSADTAAAGATGVGGEESEALESTRRRRISQFSAGGGVQTGQRGASGVGTTTQ